MTDRALSDEQVGKLVDAVPEGLVTLPTRSGTQLHMGGARIFALFRWFADNLALVDGTPAPAATGEDTARLRAVEDLMASANDYGWTTPGRFSANFETLSEAKMMSEHFAEARRRVDARLTAARAAAKETGNG